MTRISYLNGQFIDHEKAFIHVEDRGFQFGDGVYEVILFANSRLIDAKPHLDRLFSSLDKLSIGHNFSQDEIAKNIVELFRRNNLRDGSVYLQITRGVHQRVQNHPKNIAPTFVMTVVKPKEYSDADFEKGLKMMVHDDIRWGRCDIKSVALVASSLVNQKAKDLGFDDAIFVRNGVVGEATYANVFIAKNGVVKTKKADNFILEGITRNRVMQLLAQNGENVVEEDFGVDEMVDADEVFLTSSTFGVRAVLKIDDNEIGGGKVGEIARNIRGIYEDFVGR